MLFCESVSNILEPIVASKNPFLTDDASLDLELHKLSGIDNKDREVNVNAVVHPDNHDRASKCGATKHLGAGPGPETACGLVAAHALHLTHSSSPSSVESIGGPFVEHQLEKVGAANESIDHGTGQSKATNNISPVNSSRSACAIGKVISEKQIGDKEVSKNSSSGDNSSSTFISDDETSVGSQPSQNITAEGKFFECIAFSVLVL